MYANFSGDTYCLHTVSGIILFFVTFATIDLYYSHTKTTLSCIHNVRECAKRTRNYVSEWNKKRVCEEKFRRQRVNKHRETEFEWSINSGNMLAQSIYSYRKRTWAPGPMFRKWKINRNLRCSKYMCTIFFIILCCTSDILCEQNFWGIATISMTMPVTE